MNKPKVVCLCGSTRFKKEFIAANLKETMKGKIVLTVGCFSHADKDVFYPTQGEKDMLDELHKRKIDLADEVLILDVNNYIGESTASEIKYAVSNNKCLRFLSEEE